MKGANHPSSLFGTSCFATDFSFFFLPEYLKDCGLDKLAIVLDNATVWLYDGEKLIEAGPQIEVSPTRVPVTEDNEAEVMATCKLGRLGEIIGGVAE